MFKLSTSQAAVSAALAFAAAMAHAAPVATIVNTDFTGGSTMFGYLGKQFTFTDVSGGFFTSDPVAVTTAAGAKVSSLALFGPAQPTTYFDPIRGSGHLVFDSTGQYSSFTRAAIPYSASPSFIGLSVTESDGIHYGYAQFYGTELLSYAFESAAGVGIDAAFASISAVPEPATTAMMLGGLALLGVMVRGRRPAKCPAQGVAG